MDNGTEIPIYVSIRKKPPAAKVLKLLRKNEKNPATAVDDELGLMAVLNTIGDVKRFMKHLTQSAVKANSFMTLEDISDTLNCRTIIPVVRRGVPARHQCLSFLPVSAECGLSLSFIPTGPT